jgi:hypothetical protein
LVNDTFGVSTFPLDHFGLTSFKKGQLNVATDVLSYGLLLHVGCLALATAPSILHN